MTHVLCGGGFVERACRNVVYYIDRVKGFARNAAQGKIISCLPILRIKADE